MTFVNELGVEEAGIDGGGIFKDFMENITRAAFDVQYGLFKVGHLVLLFALSQGAFSQKISLDDSILALFDE